MACGGLATSGMIKAQIKCLALGTFINLGRLSEEDIVAAHERLEEAKAEFVAKQGSADLGTEVMKTDRNIETEIQRIAAEENLIKLNMMEEKRKEVRRVREIEARREEKEREEAREFSRHARKMEEKEREEAREIARHQECSHWERMQCLSFLISGPEEGVSRSEEERATGASDDP
ncbi:DDRGK domain-containing protein 1-like [Palaemon carinicauda]|uniref:DDRGK domain-containing protein 1-like n=1 Tax=Palaemon carinicauda TaxID=392227 RepID=UPI0035B59319